MGHEISDGMALYLVGLGYPRHDVAHIIDVSEGTVRNFILSKSSNRSPKPSIVRREEYIRI